MKYEGERKTDSTCGPTGDWRNIPFIDEGVQKCADYRRIGGGGGWRKQVCRRPPPGTTTPPLGPLGEGEMVMGHWGDAEGTTERESRAELSSL